MQQNPFFELASYIMRALATKKQEVSIKKRKKKKK